MNIPDFWQSVLVAIVSGFVLLVFKTFISSIFKAYKNRKQNTSELGALIALGRIVYGMMFGLVMYGILFRPILSKTKLRDEVSVITPSTNIIYDIDLRYGTRDVVYFEFEVLEGSPVNTALVPTEVASLDSVEFRHIPSFAMIANQSGKASARVEKGKWSIVIWPTFFMDSTLTKVEVKTHVSRPRFFQRPLRAISTPYGLVQESPE